MYPPFGGCFRGGSGTYNVEGHLIQHRQLLSTHILCLGWLGLGLHLAAHSIAIAGQRRLKDDRYLLPTSFEVNKDGVGRHDGAGQVNVEVVNNIVRGRALAQRPDPSLELEEKAAVPGHAVEGNTTGVVGSVAFGFEAEGLGLGGVCGCEGGRGDRLEKTHFGKWFGGILTKAVDVIVNI